MKSVLISGVNGGIGRATAQKFIDNGYQVFGIDIQNSTTINGLNYFQCDITNEDQIKQVFRKIKTNINSLDAIVSLAGVYVMDSLLEIDNEKLKKIIDINSLGAYRLVKNFFPLLKQKSKVIIISSELAPLDPLPFNGIYSISKSLLEKYAYSLRMELNLFNIDVVVLRPGAVKTSLLNVSISELDKMCENTVIHKDASKNFRNIVNSVESKSISPEKVSEKIFKIENKKHPKYVYSLNNNLALKLLNLLPHKLQVKVISKILKKKK